jgi:hypothetical protein
MTTFYQGKTATLESSWTQYGGGPPADVYNQTITIEAAGTGSVVLGPTSTGILHLATGLYSYQWAIPAAQAIGDYAVIWNASSAASGGTPLQASEIVTVAAIASTMFSTWCDVTIPETLLSIGPVEAVDPVDYVLAVTGTTYTAGQIMSAQQVLNLHTNYTPEVSGANMQPQDLFWLRYALAYQTAWMASQPGLFARNAVADVSQDGVGAHYVDENALTLAPLARRSIKQLSWKKSRSLRVRTPFVDDQTPLSSDPDSEANDLYERWVDFYNFGGRSSTVP